jgi:RNA polymerase sigma-70 factor (ECF subfamily)
VPNVASFPIQQTEQQPLITPPWGEERRLLAAMRGGDSTAAEEIVERTYSAVYASLYRLCGDGDLAADLTQETYQKAWTALASFDGRSQLFTWLYRIAYTTFLNYVRRPRRTTSLDAPETPEMPDTAPGAEEVLSEREEGERLRAAVLRLPEDLRFTVTAHFWGGLAVKEIARIENITTVAIRKRLHKAFALLEGAIGDMER